MNWQTIENSNAIKAVAYDAAAYVLGIQSLNGTPYFYVDVPPDEHERFLRAESKGRAWADIKKKYQARKGDGTLALQSPVVKPVNPKVETIIKETAAKAPRVNFANVPTLPDSIGESIALTIGTSLTATLAERLDEFCSPIQKRVDALSELALGITEVTDEKSYALTAEYGELVADERRDIVKLLKPTKQAIDSVKQVVLNKEHQLVGQLGTAEDRLKRLCTDYRVAEQRRAQEVAEAERQRKLKEAEDARIAQAEMAQAAGKTKLAEKLLDTPVTPPKVEVKAAVPTGTGAKAKVLYKWRVKDLAAVPREWLILDESKIGKHARDNKLPDGTVLNGIEFYQEPDTNF